jgi:hypothetical protein
MTLSVLVTGEVYLPPEEADARRKRRRKNSQMVVAPGDDDDDGSRSGTPPVTVWTERKLGDRCLGEVSWRLSAQIFY